MTTGIAETHITEALRTEATRLLENNEANVVIGYTRAPYLPVAAPVFVRAAKDVSKLIFDPTCMGNLAVYLGKPEVRALGRIAIVVKGCDLKALNVLLREHVVARENLYVIGVACPGVGEPLLNKCSVCNVQLPQECDIVLGQTDFQPREVQENAESRLTEIENMSIEERWDFWSREFEKCIRCYACRQACPLCYCKQCVVEKNKPQWIESSPHLRGNFAWNAIRAFHLTGRCIGCGECERVCPENIPLGLINDKMAALVKAWFNFDSGLSPDVRAPFTVWSPDDEDHGIL